MLFGASLGKRKIRASSITWWKVWEESVPLNCKAFQKRRPNLLHKRADKSECALAGLYKLPLELAEIEGFSLSTGRSARGHPVFCVFESPRSRFLFPPSSQLFRGRRRDAVLKLF